MNNKHRHRPYLMIICRILRILVLNNSECSWWKLCSSSNLNPKVFARYIEFMEKSKLVMIEAVSSKRRFVKITPKGFNLVQNVDNTLDTLQTEMSCSVGDFR